MAGETYYRKNRVKANIAPSDVAKELGLSYRRYTLIEKGIIKMPNDLINKFNEVINRGLNINKLDQLNNEQIVNEYWEKLRKKDEKGKYTFLNAEMKRFNIPNMTELGKLLGYRDCSALSLYLSGKQNVSYNNKNKLYQFFMDERNIQEPGKLQPNAKTRERCRDLEKVEWLRNFNFDEYVRVKGITLKKLGEKIGMASSTFYTAIGHATPKNGIEYKPTEKVVNQIYNYIMKHPIDGSIVVEETKPYTILEETDLFPMERDPLETKLIGIYEEKINNNNNKIEEYKELIRGLEIGNDYYREIIDTIRNGE